MSATNTTTNYNLPIFIGSDKPAWLVDFNGAMNAIDAQMKVNADAIAGKSPILTFNDTTEIDFTKTGDVITANLASGVSDKVGRALVTPVAAPASEEIVSINTSGSQSSLAAGSGINISGGAISTTVDMNLSNIQYYDLQDMTPNPGTSGTGTKSGGVTAALNSSKTIGKIYGNFYISGAAANADYGYTTGITIDPPADGQQYLIDAGIAYTRNSSGNVIYMGTAYLIISGAGSVSIYTRSSASGNILCRFDPNIYYFKDFGDQ